VDSNFVKKTPTGYGSLGKRAMSRVTYFVLFT
jgi:hypothetical protein